MHFTISRNRTYDALRQGRLKNIRMHTIGQSEQYDDSPHFDPFIGVPSPAYDNTAWNYPGGGWLLPDVGSYPDHASPDGRWGNNTVDSFSAACWYFAEALTDMAEKEEEERRGSSGSGGGTGGGSGGGSGDSPAVVVPYGLISRYSTP
jgi:hypothetical protein